ncbi:MAG: flippase-like domain-containing protein [Crocinitomicaceae bacterium]|nr:flippase-like domain-containing protein [Crocinitomicaceae bacterium]
MLKIILTISVGILFYFQIKKLSINQLTDVHLTNYFSLLVVILLTFPNYFFEYKKWTLVLTAIKDKSPKKYKIQSFFAGIITGMLTPNMQGNFIGRIFYFQRRERIPITLLTLTANLGQFITTITLGLFGLVLSSASIESKTLLIPLLIAIIAYLFYFNYEKIDFFFNKYKWYKHIFILLRENKTFRIKILWFSFLRNVIFSIQFLLALNAFGQPLDLHLFWLVWLFYLWTTLSPSLLFGKLFIRESIALIVFSGIAISEMSIITASLTIWLINLFLPTMIGLFICRKKGGNE